MKSLIMSAPMVRALLDGRKTVTRRAMKPQPSEGWMPDHYAELHKVDANGDFVLVRDEPVPIGWGPVDVDGLEGYRAPFQPGDTIYVRESIRFTHTSVDQWGEAAYSEYVADGAPTPADRWPWKRDVLPSIHMPMGLARIHLHVTSVTAERLHDITDADVDAEFLGENYPQDVLPELFPPSSDFAQYEDLSLPQIYARLWDSLNAARGYPWESNPWVWRIEFKVLT